MAEDLSTVAGTKNKRTYLRGIASPQPAASFTASDFHGGFRIFWRPLLAFTFEEGMVERQSPRADGGEREACGENCEREFIIVHCEIASGAVDLPDGHAHLDSKQQRRHTRKHS